MKVPAVGVLAALPLLFAGDAPCFKGRIPAHERVAFCINGVARTLDYGVTYKSYEKMTAAFGGTPTLFMYLKLLDTVPHKGLEARPVDAANLTKALEFWRLDGQNVRVVSGARTDPNCTDGPEEKTCRFCGQEGPRFLVEQVHTTEACFGLIETYERERRMRFDWVVHARPDISWFGDALDASSTCFDRKTVYTTCPARGFQDWVMFGGRAVAAPLFKRFSAAHDCSRPLDRMPHDQWVAVGGGIGPYLSERDIPMAAVDSPLVVIRPNVGVRTVVDVCRVKEGPLRRAGLDCRTSFYDEKTGLPRDDPPRA